MLKHFRKKTITGYPVLFALVIQLGLTSLLCATASYQANAQSFMICTSFGIKTITLDENGQPTEETEHAKFGKSCFNCASGGCYGAFLKSSDDEVYIPDQRQQKVALIQDQRRISQAGLTPSSRAPPSNLS